MHRTGRARIIAYFFALTAAIAALFLGFRLRESRGMVSTLTETIEILRADNSSLEDRLRRAEAAVQDLQRSKPGLTRAEADRFRGRGLDNPEEDIIRDLGSRAELMPFTGGFGARPSFYSEAKLMLLNARWAFVSFADYNHRGQSLLGYTVEEGGEIRWRVIETFVEER